MWLVTHNLILIKDNLTKKGWIGNTQCHICGQHETVDHLFLMCDVAQQVWFWLGKSQEVMHLWHNWDSLIQFAYSLNLVNRTCFLIVLSAVTWTIWKKI